MPKVIAADLAMTNTAIYSWHHHGAVPGPLTASSCGKCKATANVRAVAGWFCPCGHYNILPWHNHQIPHEDPTYGPSRAAIQEALGTA